MVYNFNTDLALEELVNWLKKIGERDNFNKVVLGISGGKDSTIAAALCCRAFGTENVHGLLLPNGVQSDINDSIDVCNALGISYDTINIKPVYDSFLLAYGLGTLDGDSKKKASSLVNNADKLTKLLMKPNGEEAPSLTNESLINLSPRIRMSMIRLWGQSHHYRMCGTGNLSEITVGYCTKDGDTSCDFSPFGKLTSIEVVEIGKKLKEIPKRLVVKTPTDGLCGQTDEEKLGVTYDMIHKYIRSIKIDNETWYKINALERVGLHKRGGAAPVYIPSDTVLYGANAGGIK